MITNIIQFKESIKRFDLTKQHSNYEFRPQSLYALKSMIKDAIKEHGNECDLNFIDTSSISRMSFLFYDIPEFNGDISKWNTSNVISMHAMFKDSKFDGDISNWNTSNVSEFGNMFENAKFNGDISKWDVSNVENMSFMFLNSKFTGDISNWNVSNLRHHFEYNVIDSEHYIQNITKDYIIKRYNLKNYVDEKKDEYIEYLLKKEIEQYNPENLLKKYGLYNVFKGSELENNNKIPKWYSDILNIIKK